jgi:YebC/PmpR family DNA-binding regulatory protein
MSGHSKWSTIKRKKGALDAKRGVAFTRASKDITLASREGGDDIEMNPALRMAVQKAKAVNMPKDNIERAIKKGTGDLPGMKYEDYVYEGYGPGGVAILLSVMTDNKNRTVPEIRHMMSKNGGNLGEPGCVNWMFEKKGIIAVSKDKCDENELLETALDLGADDFSSDDDINYTIITSPELFGDVTKGLESEGIEIESGELTLEPQNKINIAGNDAISLLKLLDLLEENEDIQKVYSNFEIDDDELEKISSEI